MIEPDLELCYLSGSDALSRFAAHTLSPVELMQAVIRRTQQVNPKLNAITYEYFDRALKQARDAESRYSRTDGRTRPLEGLPVAIKDFHCVKGEITTFGSRIFESFRPAFTAPTVQRLLDAGAIMHIRTTTPEFAYSGMTHSPLWGITRNPWNTEFTPGGSSGGAGAAVAAGMTEETPVRPVSCQSPGACIDCSNQAQNRQESAESCEIKRPQPASSSKAGPKAFWSSRARSGDS